MASEQDRREFGSRNADSVPPPLPSIPKIPMAIKQGLGGKFRKEWDKFESDWEEWRKKVTLPSTAATSVPITPIQRQAEAPAAPEPATPTTPADPVPGQKGDKGDKGDPGGDHQILANVNLPAFVVVTSTGLRADSATPGHRGRVVGITKASIGTGFIGPYASDGPLTNGAWAWSGPGALIFLNGTALSETAPATGWTQKIGIAVNTSTIIVELDDAILL